MSRTQALCFVYSRVVGDYPAVSTGDYFTFCTMKPAESVSSSAALSVSLSPFLPSPRLFRLLHLNPTFLLPCDRSCQDADTRGPSSKKSLSFCPLTLHHAAHHSSCFVLWSALGLCRPQPIRHKPTMILKILKIKSMNNHCSHVTYG